MPSAMSTAPKKKRDFFNGCQGVDYRDFRSPEPQEAPQEALLSGGAYAVDESRVSDPYPHTPPAGVSFPSSPEIGHPTEEFYASCHDRQSPPGGYHSLGEQERCPPITPAFHLHNRGQEFNDSAPLIEAPAPYTSSATSQCPLWMAPDRTAPAAADSDGNGDGKKAKKRKQRCRLCANHGIYVEIKGHKWYCPYKNPEHTCDKCEITRKRQYFMAEQQKLTREQQQQLQLQSCRGGEVATEDGNHVAVPARFPAKPTEFPRMQELLEETDHILDEDLFRQINECVRPKVTHH